MYLRPYDLIILRISSLFVRVPGRVLFLYSLIGGPEKETARDDFVVSL